ncbi:hypothetical protein V8E52_012051 [Russula decolorans]
MLLPRGRMPILVDPPSLLSSVCTVKMLSTGRTYEPATCVLYWMCNCRNAPPPHLNHRLRRCHCAQADLGSHLRHRLHPIFSSWVPPSPPTTATTADAPTVTDKTETKLLLHLLLTIYTVDTFAPATPLDVSPPTPHPYSSFALLLSPAVAPAPTSPSPPKDTEASTAHLLASHATSFDPQMVLLTLPSRWPLCTLSLYLVRALRTGRYGCTHFP